MYLAAMLATLAEPKRSNPRSIRDLAPSWSIKQDRKEMAPELLQSRRNRRATASLSPELVDLLPPLGKLSLDLLMVLTQEQTNGCIPSGTVSPRHPDHFVSGNMIAPEV